MDQIYQLQQQIQRLRQEVNNISQMTSQLQQFEQSNAAQLQRLQQHEVNATQQLQRIQQLCSQLSNDLNSVSSIAQQVTQSIAQNMFQPGTGYAGFGQQYGTFGTQYTPGWTGIYATTLQNQPVYTSAMPFQQQRFGTGQMTSAYIAPGQWSYAQAQSQPLSGFGWAGQQDLIQGYSGQLQNQSYAQNQQISQQAQMALQNRMNQATQGMFGSQPVQSMYGQNFQTGLSQYGQNPQF